MSTPSTPDLLALALANAGADDEDPVRDRILDAAVEQFQAIGIRRASVGDIARRAGVGRMTVYRRFPQRDELIMAAMLREAQRVVAQIAAPLLAIEDPVEQLAEATVLAFNAIVEQPILKRVRETEPEDVGQWVTGGSGPLLTLGRSVVAALLRGHVEAGRLRPQNVDLTAELLARFTMSLIAQPETLMPIGDDDALREFARQHVLPIVTGQAPPPRPPAKRARKR
ncbi:TetR/AcrR family transcriptional regulator [Patulibacter defluvii]|uniref:TetR/AcrR family transcriptional regulator n=1 Tax=Patulibacter defluvii TaxID=3095358 RepID=UPI002A749C03|nr:TetR/AcrR family transcriptional regulator [Patulibacter sp. DM4]